MYVHAKHMLRLSFALVLVRTVCTDCSSGFCRFTELKSKDRYMVDCSGLFLGCVPLFNDSIVIINLSNNNLSELYGTFSPNVLRLDLSDNPFRKVNTSTFRTLKSLEYLSLRNTSLEKCGLQSNAFRGLHGLKTLDIQYNFIVGSFPYKILLSLQSLNSLYIDGYPDGFDPEMKQLKNLKVLLLSGITGKCNIPILHERYFEHIQGIENLTVKQCGMQQIYKHSISRFVSLKHFDMSHNKNLSFAVLSNVTFDLKDTRIENFLFNEIHCTHGLGTEIFLEDFQNLQNTKLKRVYADSNRLELVDEAVFLHLPRTLQYISLSDNRLSAGKYVFQTYLLQNLKSIDISYQIRTDIPDNDDYMHCKNTVRKCQMPRTHVIHHEKTKSAFKNEILIPGHLETIYYRYSKLKSEIPAITVQNENNVKHLHLQGNTFYKWTGPIRNVNKLELLDLSNNFCSEVSHIFFEYLDNLVVLNVSDNFLGFSLQDDFKGQIFRTLHKLRILNLASNKIHFLPNLIFRNLHSLEVLNLSHNLLSNLDFEFIHMKNLRVLDISNNQVSSLSVRYQKGLTAMSDHLTMNITNNPLQCNCEDLSFWRWLATSTFVIHSSTNVCTKGKFQDIVNNHNLTLSILLMEKHCASYIELISIVSCCIFVTFILTLCAIVHRFRWKLRYLYYTMRSKHRSYTSVQSENISDEFLFDCFISYADEDRRFAFHDMMKNLENNTDIKLCFHHRDFLPGFDIAENIINAIRRSRKTICVISSNYLNSYWCMYEFNMARMENFYSRNDENCLIFIFYPPVRSKDIPLNMMYIMESQSYIEYPNGDQERIAFWLKLTDAITV